MVVEKKKYIIELPENTHWIQWIMEETKDHQPYMDFKQVEDLTPYTEPDLDAIRKEVHDKCMNEAEDLAYKLYSPKIDEAYQRGLNNAWKVARKFMSEVMDARFRNNFMVEIFECDNAMGAMKVYSASECIEKIQQYEQRQEEEKKESIIAEDIMRQYLNTFCNGRSCTCCPLDTPDFTCGRGYHFISANPISDEEVRRAYVEVRQKMEEN